MDWKEIFGFIAGALTTGAFVPQVWRLFRIRSAREISLPFAIFFLVGVASWLSYGILFDLMPVVLWNGITLVLGLAMLYAKLKYGR